MEEKIRGIEGQRREAEEGGGGEDVRDSVRFYKEVR